MNKSSYSGQKTQLYFREDNMLFACAESLSLENCSSLTPGGPVESVNHSVPSSSFIGWADDLASLVHRHMEIVSFQ